jgi:hypothetical protein
MLISDVKKPVKVKSSRRSKKKPPLASSPIIHPALISEAARTERMKLRQQSRLEAFTIICLLDFVWVVTKRVSELRKRPADLRGCYRLQSLIEHHQHSLSQQNVGILTDALRWYEELCLEMKERREQGGLFGFALQ